MLQCIKINVYNKVFLSVFLFQNVTRSQVDVPKSTFLLISHTIMFLKTVPPVVAVHSEWRSGKSFSLPLCFNDSTSESDFVSSSGTPISHKVQMIIDSLCSTQSSDMNNEVNASAQSALNLPKPSCGGHKSCHMDTLARSRHAATDNSKLHASGSDASEGSDSDDSVDRGIEEAIQEYLKEKVDHKHKKEPIESQVQTHNVQQGGSCILEAPKQPMYSTKVLITSNHSLKGSKGIQSLVALKKNKKSVKENPFVKAGAARAIHTKTPPSSGTAFLLPQVDCNPPAHRIKVEEDIMDSSSDDGIEEAIQKFQQEEKERHEGLKYFQLKEELESSSDDGIEEAIRNYQQERQKENKPKQSCLMPDHMSVKPHKSLAKKKNKKKNAVEPKENKSSSPKPVGLSLSMLPTCCPRTSGDSPCSAGADEPQDERQIHSTLTVNTTAELMCAEAILDISKTVMPAAFEPTLDQASAPITETPSFLATGVSLQQDGKSDASSVDSEDGIEQEIRKFLELKAKLHEQETSTNYPGVSTVTKAPQHNRVEENQNKALRLSFSRKRKRKEEDGNKSKQEFASNTLKEEPQSKSLTQSELSPVTKNMKNKKPTQNSPHHSMTEGSTSTNKGTSLLKSFIGSERNYSSEKSSSLDSDEDLDAAIKDLLKTKKKVKKKVRDMKLKARRSHKPMQLPGTDAFKYKSVKDQKLIIAAKSIKPNAMKNSKGLVSILRQDKGAKSKGVKSPKSSKNPKLAEKEDQCSAHKMTVHDVQSTHVDEDSSSVDSDDSIEQEIRRFLAEKAKGSSAPVTTLKQENTEGVEEGAFSTTGEKNVKIEELQTKSFDLTRASLTIVPDQQPQGSALNIKGPASSLTSYCSLEDDRTSDQLHERTLHECRNISLDTDKDQTEKLTVKLSKRTDPEPCVTGSQETRGEVQHQNLFLMKHDNCSISTSREKSSADLSSSLQNRNRIPLVEVISTVCPSPPPVIKHFLSSSSETAMVAKEDCQESPAKSRSDSLDVYSWEKKGQWGQPSNLTSNVRLPASNPAHLSCHLPPYPSHLSCVPLPLSLSQPRTGASLVHLRRDQAPVVALSAQKSNHLQHRETQKGTKEMSEGREEEQEKCIDETDVESGEERTDKRQQQCSQ